MFIRFQGALLIVALTAVTGSAIEGSILDRRRALSRQHYRLEAARERFARLRLEVEKLGSPAELLRPIERGRLESREFSAPSDDPLPTSPLLRWRASRGDR